MKRQHFEFLWNLYESDADCYLPGPSIVSALPAECYRIWMEEGIISKPFTPNSIHIPEHGIIGYPTRVRQVDEGSYIVYDDQYVPKEGMIQAESKSGMHRIFLEGLARYIAKQWEIDFEYRKLGFERACLIGWKDTAIPVVILTDTNVYPIGQALHIKRILDVGRLYIFATRDWEVVGEMDYRDVLAPEGILFDRTVTFVTEDGYPRWEHVESRYYRFRLFETPWDYDPKDDLIHYLDAELSLSLIHI